MAPASGFAPEERETYVSLGCRAGALGACTRSLPKPRRGAIRENRLVLTEMSQMTSCG